MTVDLQGHIQGKCRGLEDECDWRAVATSANMLSEKWRRNAEPEKIELPERKLCCSPTALLKARAFLRQRSPNARIMHTLFELKFQLISHEGWSINI